MRELGITKAVEMLRKRGAKLAANVAKENASYATDRDAILEKVHPEARAIVLREVTPQKGRDVPAMTAEEIDEALAERTGPLYVSADEIDDAPEEHSGKLSDAAGMDEVPARLREPLSASRLAIGKGHGR